MPTTIDLSACCCPSPSASGSEPEGSGSGAGIYIACCKKTIAQTLRATVSSDLITGSIDFDMVWNGAWGWEGTINFTAANGCTATATFELIASEEAGAPDPTDPANCDVFGGALACWYVRARYTLTSCPDPGLDGNCNTCYGCTNPISADCFVNCTYNHPNPALFQGYVSTSVWCLYSLELSWVEVV